MTAPIEQTLRLLEEPKKEIKLQIKEKDLSMADVLERSIREKAEERWKAIETERNQSKAVLTPENRKVFDVLFEAYVTTEELQKHPRLQKALEKQLLSVFVAAQKKVLPSALMNIQWTPRAEIKRSFRPSSPPATGKTIRTGGEDGNQF